MKHKGSKPVAQKKSETKLILPSVHEVLASTRKPGQPERIEDRRAKVRRREERKLAHSLKRFDFSCL